MSTERKLLSEGPGSFYVKWATNKAKDGTPLLSKAARIPMILVCLACKDMYGQDAEIYTYFSQNGSMFLYKLLDAIGIPVSYTAEVVMSDPSILVGRIGECMIDIEETEKWGKNNKVSTYIKKLHRNPALQETFEQAPASRNSRDDVPFEILDDEIPF